MTLASDEAVASGGLVHKYEKFAQDCGLGVTQKPMTRSDMVLFDDDFSDGKMHGWRPSHFTELPYSPISVEPEYPMPGLFVATSSSPYRALQMGRFVQTYKGLSARFAKEMTSGIVSFSGLFAITSGGPGAYAWDTYGLLLDMQNWDNSLRATPTLYIANPGTNGPAQARIVGTDGVARNITGLANPIGGDTVNSTKGLVGGENENKWDINYIRLSYKLGNLFSASSGFSGDYYEANINGHRFDLRTQGHGGGNFQSPQAGLPIFSFAGGLNFGITLTRTANAGAIYPAKLVAGSLRATIHKAGWLA